MVDMKYAFLKLQEEAGRLKFVCVSNDSVDEHMVWYLLFIYFFENSCYIYLSVKYSASLLYFLSAPNFCSNTFNFCQISYSNVKLIQYLYTLQVNRIEEHFC